MKPTDLTKDQISKIATFCVEQITPYCHKFNDRILKGVQSLKDNSDEMAVMIDAIEKCLNDHKTETLVPILNIGDLKLLVCECLMTRGYWDHSELTHRNQYVDDNLPPKHLWLTENRIPNGEEVFSMIHNETFDSHDLAYNFPEDLITDLIPDEELDTFLCERLQIDLSEDHFKKPIKVTKNNFTVHTGESLAIDKTLSEIDIWISQWNSFHNSRNYQPYRNGNKLFVLGQETGICIFPSPKRNDNSFLQIPLGIYEGRWRIKTSNYNKHPWETITNLEDSMLCATVAYKYLKEYATENESWDGRPIYSLPWLDN